MNTAIYTYSARPTPSLLERQEAECVRLAENLGRTVTRCYQDTGHARDGFHALLDEAASGAVTTLIIVRSDRIARRLTDYNYRMQRLREAGVTVYSVEDGQPLTWPSPRSLLQHLAVEELRLRPELEDARPQSR